MATTAQSDKHGMMEVPKLRVPDGYDPTSPEVIERRRKLFAALNSGRTPESDAVMDKLAERFWGEKKA
jgi:hypothetical protein